MDWPRAKTILIVAFLVLDLVLAAQLWLGPASATLAPASGRVREDLLREGIVFSGPLPPRPPARMRKLRVRVLPVDAGLLRDAFFPGTPGGAGPDGQSGALVFRRDGEQLTVLPQGLILYERRDLAPGEPAAAFDLAAAVRVAGEFVRRRGLLPADAGLDYAIPAPGGRPGAYQVFFGQRYGDWPLFGGYLGVEVVSGSVRALEAVWLDVAGPVGPRQQVRVTAEDALRSLVTQLSGRGPAGGGGTARLLVERVDLGYFAFLRPGATEWEAVPAWRVLTRDGRAFYVNAYLGTLEEVP